MTELSGSASSFSWLAFSDHERRRAHDAISLLRDRDTRDELGIAGVRDAFSELLFPGTSTIQTRAGYFLFVPWIYRSLEETGGVSSAARAARAERMLIAVLRESGDPAGTIGIRRGADVKRLPSSVYWQGLFTWEIRRARVPISAYHAWLDNPLRRRSERDDDGGTLGDQASSAWDPALPPAPSSFPEDASFRLEEDHGRYLRDRVMLACPGTMLAFLVDRGAADIVASAPWAHPQFAELPPATREIVEHAELFSLSVHGAALLYNLLVARRAGQQERIVEYRDRLEDWRGQLAASPRLGGWDLGRFWELAYIGNARIKPDAKRFVDSWLRFVLDDERPSVAETRAAERLVRSREISVKGARRARLASVEALAGWVGASGADRLTFRWNSAQQIARDIRESITRANAD